MSITINYIKEPLKVGSLRDHLFQLFNFIGKEIIENANNHIDNNW